MIVRERRRDQLLLVLATVVLLAAAATLLSYRYEPSVVRAHGIVSQEPAGEWVTSSWPTTHYYTTRTDNYWRQWAADNRIWFKTEAELLAEYPGRERRRE